MNHIERDLLRDAYYAKLAVNASFAGGLIARESKAVDLPKKELTAYLELTLPYQAQKDKMKSKTIGNKDFKAVRAMLEAKNKIAKKNAQR